MTNDPAAAFPAELLTQPAAARLAWFKACTIAHPRLQAMDQALRAALADSTGELLVFFYGPTGVGKTTVLQRYQAQLLAERCTELEREPGWLPLVSMSLAAPERGDFNWRDYYVDALRAMHEPLLAQKLRSSTLAGTDWSPRRSDSRATLRVALESALQQRRPLAFLLDEAQHLAKISGGRKLLDQLDCLKALALRTNTVHVLAGTYDLLILRQLSGQLSRRTRHLHFARYRADTASEAHDFKNVLWNFAQRLPLAQPPDLLPHWEFCYERSLGCIGLLKDWLTRALAAALADPSASFNLKLLERHALPLADCQKIAAEIVEGETALAAAGDARQRLRSLLGITAPSHPSATATTATKKAQSQRVGLRQPRRDPVGQSAAAASAPIPDSINEACEE